MIDKRRVIIMGAAGRDFHNFNVFFKENKNFEVVAFTATQIPDISNRKYPTELSGDLYPNGIPIYPEEELINLIRDKNVDEVVFSYSDITFNYVMEKSSLVNSSGPDFILLGPKSTMIKSSKPVIAICAVRTGCGKSQISRKIFEILCQKGLRVASIRHPMPYDIDLTTQICQRFSSYEDLDKFNCTIEEREEYEPYIDMGGVIFSGVDYKKILIEAEKESDVIIWDGGNNDFPFYKPDLFITLTDPHRPGHEISYYPGAMNVISADILIINKVNTAKKDDIKKVKTNIKDLNATAKIINGISSVIVENNGMIEGKKVLVIEDGPTVTHGNMKYGAGTIAARNNNPSEIIDPRSYAVGSIIDTFRKYNHLTNVLPAMGYGNGQIRELEETINNAECDIVVSGTPIDLNRVLKVNKPIIRVKYGVGKETTEELEKIIDDFINRLL